MCESLRPERDTLIISVAFYAFIVNKQGLKQFSVRSVFIIMSTSHKSILFRLFFLFTFNKDKSKKERKKKADISIKRRFENSVTKTWQIL